MTTRHSKLAVANPRRARIASPRREPPAETRETVRNGGSQAAQELKALRRLNEASARLWQTQDLNQGLREMLMASIDLLGADFGNIQIYHPATATLRIAAQRGFKRKFLDFFHEVSTNDDSACGRALRSGRRIIIEDVAKDAAYAAYREIARAAGYRGVQSTPLIAHDGRLLGMLSTHFRQSHRFEEAELETLDLYARQAADFIERCQTEQALRESRQSLHAIVNALSANIAVLDDRGTILIVNDRWRRFAEANHAVLDRVCEGANYFEVCETAARKGSSDAGELLKGLRAVLAGKVSEFGLEYPCHSPTEERWFNARVTRLAGGRLPRVVLAHENITDRKNAEIALRERKKKLRFALDAARAGTWSWDAKTDQAAWDDKFHSLCGLSQRHRRTFATWLGRVYPEDRPRVLQEIQKLRNDKARGNWDIEYRVVRPKGVTVWLHEMGQGVRDQNGELLHLAGISIDITERKRSEEALRESEANLLKFIDTAATGLVRNTRDLRYKSVNAAYATLVGRSVDAIVGRSLAEVLGKKALKKIRPYIDRVLRGERVEYETELPLVTEGTRWVHVIYTPDRNATGEITGWVGSITDITQAKRTGAALRESEHRFRQVAESLPQLVWTCTADGRCDYLSPQWLTYTGKDVATQLGYGWLTQLHNKDRKRVRRRWRECVARGENYDVEFRIRRHDGVYRWFRTLAAPLRDETGRVIKWFGSNTAIDDIKHAEGALRDREERLRAILNTVQDAVITIDHGGIIVSANPATERLFGYTVSELLGQNVKLLMPSPHHENHDRYLANYHRTGDAKIIGIGREVMARRCNGETFPVELSVSEVDHLDLFTGVVRDITQRKRLERELLDSTERMQREFGHELHDGLGQRLTGLEMLSHRLTERLKREVSLHATGAQHLNQELRETVTQARLISHSLAPVPLDGDGLMRGLAELAASTGRLPGVRCRFLCDPPVRLDDTAAATHLYRIAQEAVNNALKHGKARRVDISLKEGPQGIELRVENTGRPLRKEHLRGNHGMGFHLMRYRADMTGATLTIEPRKPRGARVICTLRRKI